MSTMAGPRVARIALLGNPNTGKSTLFTALAGVRQHVGNYPGVTVEKKTGSMARGPLRVELIDLPGMYSLAVRSRDEQVALDVLLGRQEDVGPVDAVLCVADATNLVRCLYLVSQVMELGLPCVLAVNMIDVARRRGITIDAQRLAERLGIPVVPVQANRALGIDRLRQALFEAIDRPATPPRCALPDAVEQRVARLAPLVADTMGETPSTPGDEPTAARHRFLARRLLFDVDGRFEGLLFGRAGNRRDRGASAAHRLGEALAAARHELLGAGSAVPGVEPEARYAWARTMVEGLVVSAAATSPTFSDRLDRVLTHAVVGRLIFAVLMFATFQAVFVGAEPLVGWIDAAVGRVGGWIDAILPDGALRGLVVDGLLGGVGGVLAFLPQILILFALIGILEDCGYMARAALLMDRFMSRIGLSGKSFIPMLSSFACAVPGVMATRVIENPRDRLTTILVAPLMTCSARLPVYALLIGAFIPDREYLGGTVDLRGLTLAGLYALGIAMAIVVALLLKRTLLRGESPPFVIELPSYKWPSARTVALRVVERGWVFVRTAGTLILAVSIVVWAALYYPRDPRAVAHLVAQRQAAAELAAGAPEGSPSHAAAAARIEQLDAEIEAVHQRLSALGRLGRIIEPAVRPLGWDWRIGCAVIASFPAREVVVATLGVVFGAGRVDPDTPEGETRLAEQLRRAEWEATGEPLMTLPVALGLMVFYALCAQCAATLAVIRRETNSWRWPALVLTYMTALAYFGALATYQFGRWMGW